MTPTTIFFCLSIIFSQNFLCVSFSLIKLFFFKKKRKNTYNYWAVAVYNKEDKNVIFLLVLSAQTWWCIDNDDGDKRNCYTTITREIYALVFSTCWI